MLKVTDQAIMALEGTLSAQEAADEQALRLAATAPGQFGLAIDAAHEGDQVVKSGERDILYVAPEVSQQLDGAELSVADGPDGAHLRISLAGR